MGWVGLCFCELLFRWTFHQAHTAPPKGWALQGKTLQREVMLCLGVLGILQE